MKRQLRLIVTTISCLLLLQLVGCAQMSMTPPQPTIENTTKLRDSGLAPAAVGNFKLDAGKPVSADKSIGIRTNDLSSPIDNSFAQYLRETLKVELQSAGLFDPNGNAVISGTLTESVLESGVGTGKALLAARFTVTRADSVQYDHELRVDSTWDSPFIGAVAIPLAAGQYQALYRKLVGALFDDTSFRHAIGKN